MAELLLGAGAAAGLIWLVHHAQSRRLAIRKWQWGLTLLAFLYWILVIAVILAFLREGTPKGAAVMGGILGFPGVIWAVLLGRFVFAGKRDSTEADRV